MNNSLKWSVMSGKMIGIPALNTDTTSNKFCMSQAKDTSSICSSCYSWSMLQTFRKNAVPRFRKNSEIISQSVLLVDSFLSQNKKLLLQYLFHPIKLIKQEL